MSQINGRKEGDTSLLERLGQRTGRREFIKWTGAGALGVVAVACEQDPTRVVAELQVDTVTQTDTVAPPPPVFPAVTLDFSSDFGVANYAYALEQLEAAFYMMVVSHEAFETTFPEAEQRMLMNLRDVETIHREFYETAIPALGGTLIPMLTPNFESINFGNRLSVLETAHAFESLGVGAYNGAGRFLDSPDLLTIAGKIVSVEGRHASMLGDRLSMRSGNFAPNAFDPAYEPSVVLGRAQPFIRNQVTLSNVPQ